MDTPPSPPRKTPTAKARRAEFYVWTAAEVDALLGADAAAFKRAYDVTAEGNWEGHTILRRVTPSGSAAEEAVLARCRDVLFAARATRVRPGRDDKVLADWNGLAIAALVRAAAVFGQPAWLGRAVAAYDFILSNMCAPDGRAQHAWRLGRVTAAGLLDDQAAMAGAALALHEATGAARHLAEAVRFAQAALTFFADGQGGFYTSASDATDVPLARPRTAHDNATPAANGKLAEVFARLWHLTGDAAWRERAEALLRAFMGDADHLAQMPTLLAAADLLEAGATVVVVGGGGGSPPPLEGLGREADQGWGEGLAPGTRRSLCAPEPLPPTPSHKGRGSVFANRRPLFARSGDHRAACSGNRRAARASPCPRQTRRTRRLSLPRQCLLAADCRPGGIGGNVARADPGPGVTGRSAGDRVAFRQCRLDLPGEIGGQEGLAHQPMALQCAGDLLGVGVARHEQDGQTRAHIQREPRQLGPVHPGHDHVGQQHLDPGCRGAAGRAPPPRRRLRARRSRDRPARPRPWCAPPDRRPPAARRPGWRRTGPGMRAVPPGSAIAAARGR